MSADGVAIILCAFVFYGALAILVEQLGAWLDRRRAASRGPDRRG